MYKELFQQDLNDYLSQHQYEVKAPVVYSDYEDYHYQTPILFTIQKKYPSFQKEELINYLKNTGHYEKVDITGNNFISLKCKLIPIEIKDKVNQSIVVDYCGVNVAKQMHIGHIRSMFIGDFVVRLHENQQDNIIIQNHIGDWGNQFGFLLNYIQQNQLENELTNKKITEYYKKAHLQNEEDEVFAKESAQVAYNLQNFKDPELHQLWEKLVNISMEEAEHTFEELNLKINMSHTKGESFYAPFCQSILKDLLDKGLAEKGDDNTVIATFGNKSPLVLQKSNGNYLYALYDLAAIKWRVENLNPDKIVYVVDKRQSLHFEQVFEIAKKAGYANNVELLHLGFGTILGKDKKPLKTKSGQSLYLDVLLEQGKEILLQDEHFVAMDDSFKTQILNKKIVGGLKFYDLKFGKLQDYVFEWEHVLNFKGGSAPYVQNAFVRIDSIYYKKFGMNTPKEELLLDWSHDWTNDEKDILFQCQKTDEIIQSLTQDYASQTLTTQMIKLCQMFHQYYEKEKILGSETEQFKLQLLNMIQEKLQLSCDVLGIETYPCEQKLLQSKKTIKP